MTHARRFLAAALLSSALVACTPPHVDLELALQCTKGDGGLPPPTTCQGIDLSCANFVDARLYAVDNGTYGDILASTCLTRAQLGSPVDLCSLEQNAKAYTLFSKLPTGKTVVFRLRALYVANTSDGCNVDFNPNPKNLTVFDAYSKAIRVGSKDDLVMLPVVTCGTCGAVNMPTSSNTNCGDMGSNCACTSANGPCMTLGETCPAGTLPGVAQIVAGDCCATCTQASPL
jgi:hypothetical protein